MSPTDHFHSPEFVKQLVLLRHRTLQAIRSFFDRSAYVEIDAPVLIDANAVESFIDPLSSQLHSPEDRQVSRRFLMTSPEIHMKRLLCRDLSKIYFLGHVFRDRERSPIHQNEFLMLEWYETNVQLTHIYEQCEQLFREIFLAIKSFAPKQVISETEALLRLPFERLSVASAWEKYAQIDLLKYLQKIQEGQPDALVKAVIASGESLRENADFDDAFTHIMVKKIEPQIGLTRPCILFDWPAQTAALARVSPDNNLLARRFEIYCSGIEIANAFEELSDQKEQRNRFHQANVVRRTIGRESLPIPESFLSDLPKMPAACGIAVGIDRLLMVLLKRTTLREIIPFAP